jgi:hypothetical protein
MSDEAASVADMAHWIREIHEEIMTVAAEDDDRLKRIEAELGRVNKKVSALCRSIGFSAGEVADA